MASQISFLPNKAYPSIPTVGNDLEAHSRAIEAIREALQTHERRSKDVLNSFVRVQELADLGLIELDGSIVKDTTPVDESTTHHHNLTYIRLDGTSDPTTGEIVFGAGIDVTGNIVVDGNVDGRDVSVDGAASDTHLALTAEHIDWSVTGAEQVHADRYTAGGGGASELVDLSDVDTAADTANFFLGTPDGSTGLYSGRAIVLGDVPAKLIRHTTSGYNAGAIVVDSSEPGSPSQGDIWFDTTSSGGFLTELSDDLSPVLGATLQAGGFNIDMGTNVITDTKVGQWATAYGWGNHASGGYADGANEADWDTAYGWGNHASGGYASSGHNHSGVYEPVNAKLARHITSTYNSADITVGSSAPGSPSKGDIWFDTS